MCFITPILVLRNPEQPRSEHRQPLDGVAGRGVGLALAGAQAPWPQRPDQPQDPAAAGRVGGPPGDHQGKPQLKNISETRVLADN